LKHTHEAAPVAPAATVTSFAQFAVLPSILKAIADLGYQHPTPVQAQCIPPALEGKDVIGLAQTGTGKTAAFGLPIIQRVARKPEMAALVIAPTRELAQQIAKSLTELGRGSGVNVAVVVGGIPIEKDRKALRSWPNILVATPGRLIDHIHSRSIVLSDIEVIAVDEADRMYDMGFMPQINQIMEVLPRKRQTMMFTATMPPEVEKLVRKHLHEPVRIQIGVTAPAARAEQKLYRVEEPDKMPLLLDLLRKNDGRVLIFARTKRKVERMARTISVRIPGVARLHGDREQSQRDTAMNGFRNGTYRILVATDIAARGIDVADIEHVVNYDFPGSPEDYIHRIGRTARVAAKGIAVSFVTGADKPVLKRLEKLIGAELPIARVGKHEPAEAAHEAHGKAHRPKKEHPPRTHPHPSARHAAHGHAGTAPTHAPAKAHPGTGHGQERHAQPGAAVPHRQERHAQPGVAAPHRQERHAQPEAAVPHRQERHAQPGAAVPHRTEAAVPHRTEAAGSQRHAHGQGERKPWELPPRRHTEGHQGHAAHGQPRSGESRNRRRRRNRRNRMDAQANAGQPPQAPAAQSGPNDTLPTIQ
jgi:ATP-dependent RNA helicase RhlE